MTSKLFINSIIVLLFSSNCWYLNSTLFFFTASHISLTASSVQLALGLPTLLLFPFVLCIHFLMFPCSNETLCIEVFSWLRILIALFHFSLLYASTNEITFFCLAFCFHHVVYSVEDSCVCVNPVDICGVNFHDFFQNFELEGF